MKKIIYFLGFCITFILSSCVKDLDFEQSKELNLEPTMVTSLINFELNHENFFPETTEINNFSQTSKFDVLQSKSNQEQIKRIKFDIEIANEIDRNFDISIKFLDASKNVIFNKLEHMKVKAKQMDFKQTASVSLIGSPEFLDVRFIEVSLEMSKNPDGSALDTSIDNKLKFKSSATLYMKI